MKIAFLNLYSGLANRGVERSISELAKRLVKNHQVIIIQGGKQKTDYPVKVIDVQLGQNITETKLTWLSRFYLDRQSFKIFQFTLKAIPYFWKEKFDILIPANGGWQSLICRVLTWIQGTKMLITGRSGPGWDERFNLFCRPDIFVALTPAHQAWAEKYSAKSKIWQIPNGVDLEKFNPQIKPLEIDLPRPIILTVGAVSPWKRHELVLAAIAKINNVSWLLVGEGDKGYKEQLINQARQRLGRRFQHINVDLEQMPRVYTLAKVFTSAVQPQEAFGNVFLEALATNLPIVTSADPSRKFIVENAGILVDPTDSSGYAAVLKAALTTSWGNLPRQQAEKFSWDAVVKNYEQLFKQLYKTTLGA